MTNEQQSCAIGMIGLGVMGRNLLLNMADHGFKVAGLDKDLEKVKALQQEGKQHDIFATANLQAFIQSLSVPRNIMLLVPAGAPVDAVIEELIPLLQQGDLIIDAGNSYFKDTDKRASYLSQKKIHFMGMGISGGEEGARHGPSIMPGGLKEDYERIAPILKAVAAKVNGDPCVTYIGPGAAGHFVKMVHNGIEYGMMQLISECYDVMKRALDLSNEQIQIIFTKWNKGKLNGYLMEITGKIFSKRDDKTSHLLIDEILAVAKQKGTGLWTSQSAMELQVPTPTIDIAVAMRDLSKLVNQREQLHMMYERSPKRLSEDQKTFMNQLEHALFFSIIMTYTQGMALLFVASEQYAYHLNLEDIARIWRGGCIIRSGLLDDICAAFKQKADLPNLLLSPQFSNILLEEQEYPRQVIAQISEIGIPIPGIMISLAYFDAYRSAWLPANLIQAQRDYFGSHTYERIDLKGTFHTQWDE